MSQYNKKFKVQIITPAGKLLDVESVSAIVPLADGQIGLLADHMPLVGLVGAGALTVRQSDDSTLEYFVAGGFAHFRDNSLSILAEEAAKADTLDATAANARLEEAKKLPSTNPVERQRRTATLAVATARLKVAQSHS